ncbi:hypothetical protein BDF14DRAFT_1795207 [Spinellus fusiger]|nr:hypothetical protein BDF14DRAFT_1795207 [Spinellus fusiger]
MEPDPAEVLRVHEGVIDRAGLTYRSPPEIIAGLGRVLKVLGIDSKAEGDYAIKCTRRKVRSSYRTETRGAITSYALNGLEPIYGDPAFDSGDEVRFTVEVCRFRNLPHLYSVDIRRLRGNVWTYKFLYHKLLELLDLGSEIHYEDALEPKSNRSYGYI